MSTELTENFKDRNGDSAELYIEEQVGHVNVIIEHPDLPNGHFVFHLSHSDTHDLRVALDIWCSQHAYDW